MKHVFEHLKMHCRLISSTLFCNLGCFVKTKSSFRLHNRTSEMFSKSCIFLLAFLTPSKSMGELICKQQGACEFANISNTSQTLDWNGCLAKCKASESLCNWYTFYSTKEMCFLYKTCGHFEPCDACLSGEANCSDVECDIIGICTEDILEELKISLKYDCLRKC